MTQKSNVTGLLIVRFAIEIRNIFSLINPLSYCFMVENASDSLTFFAIGMNWSDNCNNIVCKLCGNLPLRIGISCWPSLIVIIYRPSEQSIIQGTITK